MAIDDICISEYDFSAEERYVAGIILEYLGGSTSEEQKNHLREAVGSKEGLADLLAEAFSHTKADRIAVVHPDELSEDKKRYREIVDEWQERLRPEVFSKNATDKFFRFLTDCVSIV